MQLFDLKQILHPGNSPVGGGKNLRVFQGNRDPKTQVPQKQTKSNQKVNSLESEILKAMEGQGPPLPSPPFRRPGQ